MSNVLPFDVSFDGTNLSLTEVREKAREKGWPGIHVDMQELKKTGVMMVTRLSRQEAYDE